MVHPSELFRTNPNADVTFSAPRDVYQLDCGITNLPILNRCCDLERFAKPNVFLVFLSAVGFLQGVTLTYFRETARIWGKHYSISPDNIDWLIYTNEFFVGIIALAVAYYGNRIHRISWIGGLTIFQAVAAAMLLIPEYYKKNDYQMPGPNLCPASSLKDVDNELNYIALSVLITFQIFYAMASVSFITHGMTYIDDNASPKTSPGHIGIALACRELGTQAGIYFSWIPTYTNADRIFVSPVWLCIASATFVFAIFVAMFPKSLPLTLVRSLSASLIELASGYEPRKPQIVDGFFKTFVRLLSNKILMVNIFCSVFIQAGLVNFNIFENYFNQARFQVSKIHDTSYTQFTTNILKQPLVAISLIAAGFLAAKTKPHLKSLVKWNMVAIILVIIFFGSSAFLKCEPNTKYDAMWEQRDKSCNCQIREFQPVCFDSKTYYSPCFAGCRGIKEANLRKTYINCPDTREAIEGPCDGNTCDMFFALSQANRVITTALLASTMVTNLIINMRCILARDKATALGVEATFTTLITYLPIRAIYGAVADNYCVLPKHNEGICRLYSKNFATFLSLCTMGLMVLSLICAVIVLIFLKLTPVEKVEDEDEDEDDASVELQERQRRQSMSHNDGDSRHIASNSASLLEMENVGDDHDSFASSQYLDVHRMPRPVTESDL